MIDVVDQQLSIWIDSIIENVSITFERPGSAQGAPVISLYLMELRRNRPPSAAGRAPLQFNLRYLVTAWAETPSRAHQILGQVAFAALENSSFATEFEPLPAQMWTAFGLAPRPAFLLDVPVRKERPEPDTELVRQRMVINLSPLAMLRGTVVGPGNIPIASARIEIPSLRLVTTTDAAGAFQFTTLPSDQDLQMEIHARGRLYKLTASKESIGHNEPFVIQFPIGAN